MMRILTVLLLACQLMVWQGYAGVFDCGCESEIETTSDCCGSGCSEEEQAAQSLPVDDSCLCCISHGEPLAGEDWSDLEIQTGSKITIDKLALQKPVATLDPNQLRRPLVRGELWNYRPPTTIRPLLSSWLL
jgi:hypothetical protein